MAFMLRSIRYCWWFANPVTDNFVADHHCQSMSPPALGLWVLEGTFWSQYRPQNRSPLSSVVRWVFWRFGCGVGRLEADPLEKPGFVVEAAFDWTVSVWPLLLPDMLEIDSSIVFFGSGWKATLAKSPSKVVWLGRLEFFCFSLAPTTSVIGLVGVCLQLVLRLIASEPYLMYPFRQPVQFF